MDASIAAFYFYYERTTQYHAGRPAQTVRSVKYPGLLTRPELDNLRVVLVSARNPLNIGAAARAMSNFGFLRLRVVNAYEVAFREARSAVGASAVLKDAQQYKDTADAVSDCALVVGTTALRSRELQHSLHLLEKGAILIRKQLKSQRVALLFGSEKAGLSNQDLSRCNWLIRIPTREQHLSMNLGQAVAVCLYELTRSGKTTSPPIKKPMATAGEVDRITTVLLENLRTSGYLNHGPAPSGDAKIRRLIRRFNLQTDDAEVLLGMLRQILWKLRSQKEK
jgi:TrmH family RNA methyltransferase